MFRRVFALELRKQRKASLSVLLVMILGVLGTSFVVARGRWSFAEAYLGAITFCVIALPLIAAVLGASAAMGIRNQNVRDSEEALPSAPAGKVFGAYLASVIYFLAIVLVVFALYPSGKVELKWIWLAVPYLHFLAFALTYSLKLPVLGAGLAVILIGLDAFFIGSFIPNFLAFSDFKPALFWWLPFVIPAWLAGALALRMIARQIERNRRPGILKAAIAAMCFLFPLLFSGLLWFLIAKVFRTGTENIWDVWRQNW